MTVRNLNESNRFMKGLYAWPGFKSKGVPYVRPERSAGTTKWNYWKLWNFALDGIDLFVLCQFAFGHISAARWRSSIRLHGIHSP